MSARVDQAERVCLGCGRHELVGEIGEQTETWRPTTRILGRAGWWHAPCLISGGAR